ncbi:unnamed protein product [Effrenium voratum]|nr:unnamed protein product [Effrenium voratum]
MEAGMAMTKKRAAKPVGSGEEQSPARKQARSEQDDHGHWQEAEWRADEQGQGLWPDDGEGLWPDGEEWWEDWYGTKEETEGEPEIPDGMAKPVGPADEAEREQDNEPNMADKSYIVPAEKDDESYGKGWRSWGSWSYNKETGQGSSQVQAKGKKGQKGQHVKQEGWRDWSAHDWSGRWGGWQEKHRARARKRGGVQVHAARQMIAQQETTNKAVDALHKMAEAVNTALKRR